MRSVILCATVALVAMAAGCQSDTGLRALPTYEVEEVEDPENPDRDGFILVHVDPPDMPEGEDVEEEPTPAPGPDTVECPERVLYDPHYFAYDPMEVAGYPVMTVSSPAAVEITPGEPLVYVFTITATCGPIRWRGGDLWLAPSGDFGEWNAPFWGSNQVPMPLEDVGLGQVQEIHSYCVAYAAEGQVFWPARETSTWMSNEFVGRDLAEGESVTYAFTFDQTGIVPVGETLRFGLTMGVWTDVTTGTELFFDGNLWRPMTVTVVGE